MIDDLIFWDKNFERYALINLWADLGVPPALRLGSGYSFRVGFAAPTLLSLTQRLAKCLPPFLTDSDGKGIAMRRAA